MDFKFRKQNATRSQRVAYTLVFSVLLGLLVAGWAPAGHLPATPQRPWIGAAHNRVLQQAFEKGLLSTTTPDAKLPRLVALQVLSPSQQAAFEGFLPIYERVAQQYNVDQRTSRAAAYKSLGMGTEATALAEQIFRGDDTLSEAATLARLQALVALIAQLADSQERWALSAALDIAIHSAQYWQANASLLEYEGPDQLQNPDQDTTRRKKNRAPLTDAEALKRLKWRHTFKADAFGFFKGLIAGLIWFGGDGPLWDVPNEVAFGGGLAFVVVVPVVESVRYSRRVRTGKTSLFDDPWWGAELPKPQF